MKKSFLFLLFLSFCLNILTAQEERFQYLGMAYNAVINDNRVNVRSYPSLQGDVLFQLNRNHAVKITGVSKDKVFIDNYNGYWVQIRVEENQNYSWREGWVFSKYVDGGNISPGEIKISGLAPEKKGHAPALNGSYMKNGKEISFTVYLYEKIDQNYYVFAWNINNYNYSYNNIPGFYAWYPDTNELRHIAYLEPRAETGWVVFSDNFKSLSVNKKEPIKEV